MARKPQTRERKRNNVSPSNSHQIYFCGSLTIGAPTPSPLSNTPGGSPLSSGEDGEPSEDHRAPRASSGTRSIGLRGVDAISQTVRFNRGALGTLLREVTVENSRLCVTGGPSGQNDLSKSQRDFLRGVAKHAVTCGGQRLTTAR
jgi:hypothetical protein